MGDFVNETLFAAKHLFKFRVPVGYFVAGKMVVEFSSFKVASYLAQIIELVCDNET